jgi:hypothetical protein
MAVLRLRTLQRSSVRKLIAAGNTAAGTVAGILWVCRALFRLDDRCKAELNISDQASEVGVATVVSIVQRLRFFRSMCCPTALFRSAALRWNLQDWQSGAGKPVLWPELCSEGSGQ